MGEQRRYFPDWTAQLLDRCAELEADHNSYLAGGYAEEFGYRAQPEFSRGVPVIDGESPDACAEHEGQAQATHPGYPIRAHPLEIEWAKGGRRVNVAIGLAYEGSLTHRQAPGAFVPVSQRCYEQRRRDPAERGAALSRRLAAALFSLQRSLGRRG
jgi:hypothetical protein